MCTVTTGPELVDLVNRADQVLEVVERDHLRDGTDRWRIVCVLVADENFENLLLGKRCETKLHNPGKWTSCVVGTVEAGEQYLEAALRETAEEIGVKLTAGDLDLVYKGPWDSANELRNLALYLVRRDLVVDELDWDREEADEIAWWNINELVQRLKRQTGFLVPRGEELIETVIQWAKKTNQAT